ncbi:hypothetical protein IQ241_22020 [Romeria aff. gracilis LEGE 07310]|uniref:Uncharacterized protein n=1 Tax=Vasconcelosia minhoensis LEGE 07310 TaxID=915328 RepID=A0A8J7ALB6_9CYAN|nr:hypothetical protein [Romeria gracilis]MBE9079933.1 hypothetical protein [Romeria aff. gracilis LEGE 07310]
MSNLKWLRRLAAVELKIARLEREQAAQGAILEPTGWIGEAFELQQAELEALREEVSGINGKLEIILQHLTGTGDE